MAHSMTGYGVGRASGDGLSVVVELRSVNNRYLDLNLKLPRALYPHESNIRDLLRERVERGRVSMLVSEEWSGEQGPVIRLDRARALSCAGQLEELSRELGLSGEVQLEHLLAVGELFLPDDDSSYHEQLWGLTRQALEKALEQMLTACHHEGEALCADIRQRIRSTQESLALVKELAARQADAYRERLTRRLEELLEDSRLDRTRLETEIALAADRLDISEEIVRLESHLDMFHKTIARKGSLGKTLSFILQEMSREANTIASKSWMVEISQAAIRMKELLEQIREQVQNLA